MKGFLMLEELKEDLPGVKGMREENGMRLEVVVAVKVAQSCPTLCDPMATGVGCHALLQEIFPTQELNPGLLYCRQNLYHLSHQGRMLEIGRH